MKAKKKVNETSVNPTKPCKSVTLSWYFNNDSYISGFIIQFNVVVVVIKGISVVIHSKSNRGQALFFTENINLRP